MSILPTINIEGVRIPKVLIGTNSLLGWSHTGVGRDKWITRYYTARRLAKFFERCVELGLDCILGPVWPRLIKAIKIAEKDTGHQMTLVSTTIGDQKETEKELKMLNRLYSPICCIHGGWTDSWPLKNSNLIDFQKYLSMIRDAGMIPGVACHNGERLSIVDEGGYDVSVFVTPVNKLGFYMNPSQKSILDAIGKTRKPVIAIKPLASGRFEEQRILDWFKWVLAQKGVSTICIGFMSEEEAEEDIVYLKDLLS